MFSGYQPANFVFFVVIVFVYYFNDPSSARLCYVCASTFPPSQICLPSCSPSYRPLSTCLLTRNIPLVPVDTASLRAAHIDEEPILADAAEKNFLYGEEAVYLSPSPQVGWDWEYGAITYGCDSEYVEILSLLLFDERDIELLSLATAMIRKLSTVCPVLWMRTFPIQHWISYWLGMSLASATTVLRSVSMRAVQAARWMVAKHSRAPTMHVGSWFHAAPR